MVGYYISAGICLFLLVMMPIWSPRQDSPSYPFAVLALLIVVVLVVPIMVRRRKREGAADPDAVPLSVEPRD
jgi:MFS superfamily sulfate permease-like transporter